MSSAASVDDHLHKFQPLIRSTDPEVDLRYFATLAHRLESNLPVITLAVGSSLTGVHGGCTEAAPVLKQSGELCKCPLCCGSRCGSWGEKGWARSVHEWLDARRPTVSGSKCFNLGEPGGTLIPAIVACPFTYLNMDGPHLVLVDALTSSLKDLERLLRHLLGRRAVPVLVQFFRFFVQGGGCVSKGRGAGQRLNGTTTTLTWLQHEVSRLYGTPPRPLPLLLREFFSDNFTDTMAALEKDLGPDRRVRTNFGTPQRIVRIIREDRDQMLERRKLWAHYRLPVANLWEMYALAAEAQAFDVCGATIGDGFHPSSKRGGWAAAGILMHIQRALAAVNSSFVRAHGPSTSPPEIPRPLRVSAARRRTSMMCFSFDQAGYELATASKLNRQQKEWTYSRGNRVELRSVARWGVIPALPERNGWEFVAKEHRSRTKDKPGLVAVRPGARLGIELTLPPAMQAPSTEVAGAPGACSLVLEHLTGYDSVGKVRLSCQGGCNCETSTLDSSKGALGAGYVLKASRVKLLWLQSDVCRIMMELLNATSPGGGTRFKLARILVERERQPSEA